MISSPFRLSEHDTEKFVALAVASGLAIETMRKVGAFEGL
jgi:hypothetical protein